jgi:hypothetical protein
MSMTVDLTGLTRITSRLNEFTDLGADACMRTVAVSMAPEIRERIHERGEKADGTQIGTYSTNYIKKRVAQNRSASKQVILSLTGQLENDFALQGNNPVKITGGYSLGFTNSFNNDKAVWNQQRYGKTWALQARERQLTLNIATEFVNTYL